MTQHTASGDGAPSSAPPSIGAHYTDTSTGDQYLAKGTASAKDWIILQRSFAPVVTDDPFFDIDPMKSTLYITTLNSNTAPTIGTAAAGTRVNLIMTQGEDGYCTVTWPDSIDWVTKTFGEVAQYPNQVTRISLWSLGGGRWVGELNKYGTPVRPLYAAAWQSNNRGTAYLSVADESGRDVVYQKDIPELGEYRHLSGYAAVAVSKDSRWAALTLGNEADNPLIIWDLYSGEHIKVNKVLPGLSPAGPRLQFHDGYLWGRSDDGFFRINPFSGQTESMVIDYDAEAVPQEWSISGENITLNFNHTTSGSDSEGNQLYPAQTYNLATGLLAEVQFPLPEGTLLNTGDSGRTSPYGAAGAYSPDGAYYALCTKVAIGESQEDAEYKTVLVVYEVSTNTVVHNLEAPENSAMDHIVTWSYGGRYVAVVFRISGEGEIATILDVQEGTHSVISGESPPHGVQAVIMDDGVLVISGGFGEPPVAYAPNGNPVATPGWAKMLLESDSSGDFVNTACALASNGASSE